MILEEDDPWNILLMSSCFQGKWNLSDEGCGDKDSTTKHANNIDKGILNQTAELVFHRNKNLYDDDDLLSELINPIPEDPEKRIGENPNLF